MPKAAQAGPTLFDGLDLDRMKSLAWFIERNCKGPERARTAKFLQSCLGINERECREMANRANAEGLPIVSGNDGYFWAETFEDFEPMLARLRHQRDKMHERILSVEQLRAKRFGDPTRADSQSQS